MMMRGIVAEKIEDKMHKNKRNNAKQNSTKLKAIFLIALIQLN